MIYTTCIAFSTMFFKKISNFKLPAGNNRNEKKKLFGCTKKYIRQFMCMYHKLCIKLY